jgi:hypothetical protein
LQKPSSLCRFQSAPKNRLGAGFPGDLQVDGKTKAETFFECLLIPTTEDPLVRATCNASPSAIGW